MFSSTFITFLCSLCTLVSLCPLKWVFAIISKALCAWVGFISCGTGVNGVPQCFCLRWCPIFSRGSGPGCIHKLGRHLESQCPVCKPPCTQHAHQQLEHLSPQSSFCVSPWVFLPSQRSSLSSKYHLTWLKKFSVRLCLLTREFNPFILFMLYLNLNHLASQFSCLVSFPFWLIHFIVSIKMCVCSQSLSRVWLFVTPWTVACRALLSMEFCRQEYRSGLPFPSPGDLPDPGIEPTSLESPALAGQFFTTVPPGKPGVLRLPEGKENFLIHSINCYIIPHSISNAECQDGNDVLASIPSSSKHWRI